MSNLVALHVVARSPPAGPVPPPCPRLAPPQGSLLREGLFPRRGFPFFVLHWIQIQLYLYGEREGHGTYIYMAVTSPFHWFLRCNPQLSLRDISMSIMMGLVNIQSFPLVLGNQISRLYNMCTRLHNHNIHIEYVELLKKIYNFSEKWRNKKISN